MIKVDNIETWGFEHAIRGMRNPKHSWVNSDSCFYEGQADLIGILDMTLMRKLYNAGTEHRKFLRQIFVSMDITAPQFWWQEFDQYKVGVVTDSTSKMHTLMQKPFRVEDFSFDTVLSMEKQTMENAIDTYNDLREMYREEKDPEKKKKIWRVLIEILPESYNQMRTVTMNYENVVSIIHQRENHKLEEWRTFCKELRKLPYIKAIMAEDETQQEKKEG